MVWHYITFELLQVVTDSTHYKPSNTLGSLCFLPDKNLLCTAGNKISIWTLERQADNLEDGDEEDLVSVLYNARFNQAVLVRSLGSVKIYQTETGEIKRQFSCRPVDPLSARALSPQRDRTGVFLPMIQQAALDSNMSRLVVLACEGSVSFFNLHDGTYLFQVQPQLLSPIFSASSHPSGSKHIVVTNLAYDTYTASQASDGQGAAEVENNGVKALLLCTELGGVCIYHEGGAHIDSLPAAFLRLPPAAEEGEVQYLGGGSSGPPPSAPKPGSLSKLVKNLMRGSKLTAAATIGEIKEPVPPSASRRASVKSPGPRKISVLTAQKGSLSDYGEADGALTSGGAVIFAKVLSPSPHCLVSFSSGRFVLFDLQHDKKLGDVNLRAGGARLSTLKQGGGGRLAQGEGDVEGARLSGLTLPEVHDIHLGAGEAAKAGASSGAGEKVAVGDIAPNALPRAMDDSSPLPTAQDVANRKTSLLLPRAASSHVPGVNKDTRRASALRGGFVGVLEEASATAQVADVQGGDGDKGDVKEENSREGEKKNRKTARAKKLKEVTLKAVDALDQSDSDPELCSSASATRATIASPVERAASSQPLPSSVPPQPSLGASASVITQRRDSAALTMLKHRSLFAPASEPLKEEESAHEGLDLPKDAGDSTSAPKPRAPPRKFSVHTMRRWTVRLPEGEGSSSSSLAEGAGNAGRGDHPPMASSSIPFAAAAPRPSHHAEPVVPTTQRISVDAMVTMPRAGVILGACSDRTLRFWDATGDMSPLCTLSYLPPHIVQQIQVLNAWRPINGKLDAEALLPHEVCKVLAVSDSEDVVLGGFESGRISVWSVHLYSLQTLKTLVKKHIFTCQMSGVHKDFGEGVSLALSPLTLIGDWQAHPSPLLALDYVWFDYEDDVIRNDESGDGVKASLPRSTGKRWVVSSNPLGREVRERRGDVGRQVLEGYVLSAGIDQKVMLWTLTGQCVGEFGTYGWDINAPDTWGNKKRLSQRSVPNKYKVSRRHNNSSSLSTAALLHSSPRSSSPPPPVTARNITKESVTMQMSSSSKFLLQFMRSGGQHNAKDMNAYVEALSKKMSTKPPSYLEVDNIMKNLMVGEKYSYLFNIAH